jgi:hypothetical protein
MKLDYFKREIERAYDVLGGEGECMNYRSINGLYEDKVITEQEKKELLAYNKEIWKRLVAEGKAF